MSHEKCSVTWKLPAVHVKSVNEKFWSPSWWGYMIFDMFKYFAQSLVRSKITIMMCAVFFLVCVLGSKGTIMMCSVFVIFDCESSNASNKSCNSINQLHTHNIQCRGGVFQFVFSPLKAAVSLLLWEWHNIGQYFAEDNIPNRFVMSSIRPSQHPCVKFYVPVISTIQYDNDPRKFPPSATLIRNHLWKVSKLC